MTSRKSETFSGPGWAVTYHEDGSVSRYCSAPATPPMTREERLAIRKEITEKSARR